MHVAAWAACFGLGVVLQGDPLPRPFARRITHCPIQPGHVVLATACAGLDHARCLRAGVDLEQVAFHLCASSPLCMAK